MRILIDTHILLWHLEGDSQLSLDRRNFISDPANSVSVSLASLWELAIKISLGKLSLSRSLDDLIAEVERSSSSFLPIEPRHTVKVSQLPFLHKDPFDRLIIAQALSEDLPVITADSEFGQYGVKVL